MTNNVFYVRYVGPGDSNNIANYHDNVWFPKFPVWGEVGCYFFSNAVPAAVELQLGVLEDRALQRAGSLPFGSAGAEQLSGAAVRPCPSLPPARDHPER